MLLSIVYFLYSFLFSLIRNSQKENVMVKRIGHLFCYLLFNAEEQGKINSHYNKILQSGDTNIVQVPNTF